MIDQRNLILAVVLSIAILLGFQFLYEGPRIEESRRQQATEQAERAASPEPGVSTPAPTGVPVPRGAASPTVPGGAPRTTATPTPAVELRASRAAALEPGRRVRIDSPRLHGSILLDGGRIDDLTLADYHEVIDTSSPEIVLFSPAGAPNPYYAEFGWVAASGEALKTPGPDAQWQTKDRVLSPGKPVRLAWDNGEGLRFIRTFSLDEDFMLSVVQRVENGSGKAVTLHPYGLVARTNTPEVTGFFILHEGILGVFDGTLDEVDYDDLVEAGRMERSSTGGWLGITDKYWLAALIPDQSKHFAATYNHTKVDGRDKYQVDYLRDATRVPAGGLFEVTDRLFAGAKEVNLLDRYEESLGITLFDRAIDWGYLYWLTQPIFTALDYFNSQVGNFGLAILLLTVVIKILFFPLANKSYKAMSKMKRLQPEVAKMKERAGDDRQRLNTEMMALYKKEGVNPMAGCLPMVIQIPVFFSLYKVLFVTIEMRHAPFYGWISDLSVPDPTTVVNLFGLIPWTPPAFIPLLGVWPLLMGISMFLQFKLNPKPADPIQAKLFMFMPIMFTFLLASFPAGLVIYWTWNNILSMAQQWYIMQRTGPRT